MANGGHARPAVSAHQGGGEFARAGTYESYRRAVEAGAEYAEFDVRRTADGTFVACHRVRAGWLRAGWGRPVASVSYGRLCRLAGFEVPRMVELMQLLAGRAIGHLDLKVADCAFDAVRRAAEVLGPAGFVVTIRDGELAAAIKHRAPDVAVGVTIGGDLPETAEYAIRRARAPGPRADPPGPPAHPPGLGRLDRVLAARADWAVIHHRLARPALLAACRSRGIKTMVWTVNGERALARWLADPDVDALVTDRPGRAVALRNEPMGT